MSFCCLNCCKVRQMGLSLLLMLGGWILSSCAKTETLLDEETETETVQEDGFMITADAVAEDVWTTLATRAGTSLFMFYIFDSEGECLQNGGNYVSESMSLKFSGIKETGTYTICCVIGWYAGEFPSLKNGPITMEDELPIPASQEMYLGSTQLSINSGQKSYTCSIVAKPIMAKASFTVRNVEADCQSIRITLPQQGNRFLFNGTILASGTISQTYTLTKATEVNADGSYDWSMPTTLIYPTLSDALSMPIEIIATNAQETLTFKTSTTHLSTAGRQTNYQTNWQTAHSSMKPSVTQDEWEEATDADVDMSGDNQQSS